jgi:hypothetical protein
MGLLEEEGPAGVEARREAPAPPLILPPELALAAIVTAALLTASLLACSNELTIFL